MPDTDTELTSWNQRMLDFMKFCIDNSNAESQQDFLESIGFTITNLRQVKSGLQSFPA